MALVFPLTLEGKKANISILGQAVFLPAQMYLFKATVQL